MRISDWSSDVCSSDLLVDSRGFDEREAPLFGGLDDGRRQRMLAAALETRGNPEQILLFEAIGDFDGDDRRLALGKRTGFVDDKRVYLFHPLERLGILDHDADFDPAPPPDHHRHRPRDSHTPTTAET